MASYRDVVGIFLVVFITLTFCLVSSFIPVTNTRYSPSSTSKIQQHDKISAEVPQLQQKQQQQHNEESRRSVFTKLWKSIAIGTVAVTTTVAANSDQGQFVANAASESTSSDLEDVYFGVGCFWHIQHEFVDAEKTLLQRTEPQLTSRTGYAGGTKTDNEGRVCYHNPLFMADYGKLGHGEVVGMTLPKDKIVDFSSVYFSLFDPRTKERVDPGDQGPEYRSLIGLPGGMDHPSYTGVEEEATKAGFSLVLGKGNDPDTFRKRIIYVYDSKKFPFYQAEVYHQYHNDFQSKPYGKAYNNLANIAFEEGRLKVTNCPDRV